MSFKRKKINFDPLNVKAKCQGILRYKQFAFKYGIWKEVYAILSENGILFLYNSPLKKSEKVCFSISMKEVSRVEQIRSSTERFAFAFIPYISSETVTKLAALNERELDIWLQCSSELRDRICLSEICKDDDIYNYDTNSFPRRFSSSERVEMYDLPLHSSVVESKSGPTEFVNDLIIFDDANHNNSQFEEVVNLCNVFSDFSFFEEAPAVDMTIAGCDDDHSYKYYSSAYFYGTESEAAAILHSKALNGVYLVRADPWIIGEHLDVLDDFIVLSFQVLHDTLGCRLKQQDEQFENITFLMYHYSFNYLPNTCAHLEIPFGLIESI